MTRLLTSGWETGDPAELGTTTLGSGSAATCVNATPTPRAGSYCLKLSAATSTAYKTFALGAAKTDVWLRCAIYIQPGSANFQVFWALDSASGAQVNLQYNVTDNLLRLYLGSGTSTLLATASAALSASTWHALEVRYQITSTSSGTVEVWIDGTRVINFSGDNSNTANVNVQTLVVGIISNPSTAAYVGLDDLAINDTAGTLNTGRPGDGRVVLLLPTGAGSSTVLSRGGTDTGANYSQVSEVPPSMTQYVYSASAGDRDLYAMSNLPAGATTVNAVEVIALAQNSDAGAGSLGLTIKSDVTTNEAAAAALGTSAGYVRKLHETDPATPGVAWLTTAVNAVEAGVTVR